MQCQCCDSICVYTGDSNAIEHKEKNDGDSDHGILTESKNGSEGGKGETRATVLQVRVSCTGVPEIDEYPENGNYIAIDSCASVSVSGQEQDFPPQIEVGTKRVSEMVIEGICGAKSVDGRGTIATVVQASGSNGTIGMPVSIYDHKGMYLKGNSKRIFNARKLAELGCVLKMNYWSDGYIPQWIPEYGSSSKTRHVIIPELDGTVVPLYLHRNILSARTQNLDMQKLQFPIIILRSLEM